MKFNFLHRFAGLVVAGYLVPIIAFAQPATGIRVCTSRISGLVDLIVFPLCLISVYLIPMLVAIAVISIMFFTIKYISNPQDEAKRQDFRKYAMYSLWALFVLMSIGSMQKIIGSTFNIGQGGLIRPPQLQE
jgi:heme O synthase-like polyprenyltransferase